MALHVRQLTSTSGPEIEQAIETLIDAFQFQRINFAFNGFDEALTDSGWRSNLLCALAPNSGEVWVAGLKEGDIDAVCMVYGRNRWYLKGEAEKELRDAMFSNKLSEKGKHWFSDEFLPKVKELHRRALGENAEERERASWYIDVLGTRTDKQGNGLGGALIRKIFERAAIDGAETVVGTCTIQNVAFYERLGFVNGGEPVTVRLDGEDSTRFWCLIRPSDAVK